MLVRTTAPKPVINEYDYSETFERLSERICENCAAQDNDCSCLETSCYHWSDMLELLELCNKVDELAESINKHASRYSRADIHYDYMLDNY